MDKKHKIVDLGRATRFSVGGRNCPVTAQRRASPPWSIKRAVKQIMRATFDPDRQIELDDLLRVFCPRGKHVTGQQFLAIRLVLMALNGNLYAMQRLEYMVDGPPPAAAEVDALRPPD